jgi:quercetin dioxygenase-like cupin family protein
MLSFIQLPRASPFGGKLNPIKSFNVLGAHVDVITTGEMTGGRTCVVVETSPPGGGPPPHSHQNEDESFYVLEGEYEILSEGKWHKLAKGQGAHSNRGNVHTFRNSTAGPGKILIVISPAGFENYLEEISVLTIPNDMPQLLAISDRYGVKFFL